MSDKGIIERAGDVMENITKFRKQTKLQAGYREQKQLEDSNIHSGYFCYNCTNWLDTMRDKCMIVDDKGSDLFGNYFDIITPHGYCNGYAPNYQKIKDPHR
jgi:hypothetical protein